jgi:alanine racemase
MQQHDQRHAWIVVDLAALKKNALMLATRAAVPLLPMVKADAYGLGVENVVPELERLEPWGYGVATIAEGAQIRALGISRPVLVFTPVLATEFTDLRTHRLTPTLGDRDRIDAWHRSGGGRWHLSIDTGMSRTGIRWEQVASLRDSLLIAPPEGAFTHFHSADANDGSLALQQQRFDEAISQLPARPQFLHAENSPAIERQSPSRWDLARPGVALYGVGGSQGSGIRPNAVVSLHGRIVEIREVRDGETVSYGAAWRAQGTRRIATASAGYGDGVRRSLSNRGVALVRDTRVPIAGIVTMDMTMLDVTGVECAVGDRATFLGRQVDEELPIADVAALGGLSPYELLVGLRLRAPREYRGAGA